MRRHITLAALLWIALTVIGEFVVFTVDRYPVSAAREAKIIDEAFQLLLYLGMPVFTFVVAAMVYSIFRFRVKGGQGHGPYMPGSRRAAVIWLVVTTALTVVIVIHPGLTGMAALRDNDPNMVVQIRAEQWNWTVTYPENGVTIKKAKILVLPIDRQIKFEVTSEDVLHSFWIPAFRQKVDAVPGLTTSFVSTPDMIGDGSTDFNFRVQCAELCGTGHARMKMEVSVIEAAEFEGWITSRAAASTGEASAKEVGG